MPARYRGIYLIDGFRVERFDIDLLVAAQVVHRAATGHSEATLEEQRACLGFLQARVDDWVDSLPGCEFFDEAVFNLCRAAVMEYQVTWPEVVVDVKILDKNAE